MAVENRLRDALEASGRPGVIAEAARWRRDDRYASIRLIAVMILGQRGLLGRTQE